MLRESKSHKANEGEKKGSITYWAKEKVKCPVCGKAFDQEVMHKGGGRMIAGRLTDDSTESLNLQSGLAAYTRSSMTSGAVRIVMPLSFGKTLSK